MPTLNLPVAGGKLAPYAMRPPREFPAATPPFNRIAYAAAHVVADPLADGDPWLDAAIDWERTIAFRRHLWSLGLGVAEAMDTAQRGMGLDWPTSLELIRRTLEAARDFPGALTGCGAGTDQLEANGRTSLDDVIRAYEEQCAAIEKLGGRIVLMASRALVKAARSPDDYAKVYGRILGAVKAPVIIHWLGEMFDPALDGYWGHQDHYKAMEVAVDIIADHGEVILQSVEISHEHHAGLVEARRRLEDVPRERHRRREHSVKRRAIAARKRAEGCRGRRRDGIENAEQRVRVTPRVAGDQLRVVKIIAGIHAYARGQPAAHGDLLVLVEE